MGFQGFGRAVLFILVVGLATPLRAEPEPYLSINMASRHINADQEYNESNFGLGLGLSFAVNDSWRTTAELGFYKNSYFERSYYLIGSADYQVYRFRHDGTLHLGAFAGLSHYGDRTIAAKKRGFISVGPFIVVAGLQATYKTKSGTEVVLGAVPAKPNADVLLTLQFRQPF